MSEKVTARPSASVAAEPAFRGSLRTGAGWHRASALLLLGLAVALGPREAEAQFQTKVGSFVAPTGGGPNQNQSVTGLGFTPRAVIFYWTTQSATGFATGAAVGYGFATATGNRAVAFASQDNVYPNNPSRSQWTNRCIVVTNASGAVDAEANLNTMDADGFTVRWQPRGTGAWIIHYTALGGPDLTNAFIGTYTPSPGAIGSDLVTGVGFQPNFVMFLSIDSTAASGTVVTTDGKVSLGFDGGGGNRGGLTAVSRTGGANIITSGAQRTDFSIVEKDTAVGTMTFLGNVSNFSADGFTIFKSVNSAGTETPVHYLALGGGRYKVGAITRPTTDIPPALAVPYTGVGFTPRGLLFASWNLVGAATPDQEARISFSAADSTPAGFNQRATFFHDKLDAPGDGDSSWVRQGTLGTAGSNGKVAYLAQAGDCWSKFPEPGGVGTSPNSIQCSAGPRLISDADVLSYDADGFTLGWTTNDRTNANEIPGDEESAQLLYVAFGRAATQPLYRSVGTKSNDLNTTAQTVTISGTTATFNGPMPDNVGVGDVLQYQVSSTWYLAFIHGRTSSSDYTVRSATGGTPQAAVAGTAVNVHRAYTSLFNWEAQNENPSINATVRNFDTSTNLVAANTVMNVACYGDGEDTTQTTISGWTTDSLNSIRIYTPYLASEVGIRQRHRGVWDTSKYAIRSTYAPIDLGDAGAGTHSVWIDGLQIWLDSVTGGGNSGIITNQTGTANHRFSNNIVRGDLGAGAFDSIGIYFYSAAAGSVVRIWNNIVYDFSRSAGAGRGNGISVGGGAGGMTGYVYNNTVYNCFRGFLQQANGTIVAKNNIYRAGAVGGSPTGYSGITGPGSDYNSSEFSGDSVVQAPRLNTASPWYSGATAEASLFVSPTGAPRDLHLLSGTIFQNVGADLSADPMLAISKDIDLQVRTAGGWDIGADEYFSTTAVRLVSFAALGTDGAVELSWRTGSELDNIGFHLYRGLFENGPWTRLDAALIPGLGSSAVGQAYAYRDAGLQNGTRYYYRLEDVDASSKTTSHGPVSAVPQAGAAVGGAADSEPPATSGAGANKTGAASTSCPAWVVAAYGPTAGAASASASLRCTRHGDSEAVSLGVVSRDARSATLELRTGGFYAVHETTGRVRIFVRGFDFPEDPQAPALPQRRALVEAVVGRRVQLGGVRALETLGFPGLEPVALGQAEMQVARDGTVRARRRAPRELAPRHATLELARLLPSVFQEETKSAVVELRPLRYDARRGQLLLSRRLRVKLLFTGREPGESGRGSFGRRERPGQKVAGELLARLYTQGRGLHAVRFEQLFPGRSRGFASSQLRLERQGEARGIHLEPAGDVFGPGSLLYFHADVTAASTDYAAEVAWELVRARDGTPMPLVVAAPSGDVLASTSRGEVAFETNRFYQPGLLDAPDPWLWEGLPSGATRVMSFSLTGVRTTASQPAELDVYLQGASESGKPVDHHVVVSVNGVPAGEAQFAGKRAYRMALSLPRSVLCEGSNELSLTNVADTGVSSYVFLDRFTLAYAQGSSLATGVFEGSWSESGTASVAGAAVAVLDVTAAGISAATAAATAGGGARWLTGHQTAGGTLGFRAEAGHRYLAVSQAALLVPRVAMPSPSTLRSTQNQADYILIAPRAFLEAAEPLLQRRHDQGLTTRAVAFEEIADAFGHGQPAADAIKAFLAFAFQSWQRPSPRYVLLVGDSSYDPRNFTGTSQPSPLPARWIRTSYLWTASDPELAAVNGEDPLPDLALGRVPATTAAEASALVQKLVTWEESGQGLSGAALLVADNPDLAGDFDTDIGDIARSYLQDREVRTLKLSELGAGMRPAIREAFDSGLSLVSYVGHGGAAVWASENVWNSWDAASLLAQSRQPLLLTLNCLNGYFVAPAFNSLAESLLKTSGRGAIAAFSPSGLSVDGPAHQYHRALMAELVSGRHDRLGDAILAAQKVYAASGLMPELLSVHHLFGDPATPIHP